MESHLKKRLLGALLTVLLVAILLPVLIQSDYNHSDIKTPIPTMPKLPAWSDVKNQKEVRLTLAELAENAEQSKEQKAAASEQAQKPPQELDTDEVDAKKPSKANDFAAWSLKVAAFKNPSNAKKLVQRLQKEGYKAYSKGLNGYTRVYIGPEIDKQKIQQAKIEIEAKLKQKNLPIISYKP